MEMHPADSTPPPQASASAEAGDASCTAAPCGMTIYTRAQNAATGEAAFAIGTSPEESPSTSKPAAPGGTSGGTQVTANGSLVATGSIAYSVQ